MSVFDYSHRGDPYSVDWMDMRWRIRQDFGVAMAVRDPRAQMKISNVPEPAVGPRVIETELFGDFDGAMLVDELFSSAVGLARSTPGSKVLVLAKYNRLGERTGVQGMLRLAGADPVPFYTRHSLGMREAARDRRRRR